MEFYWLHCRGPDGPCVLMAIYSTRTNSYRLVDDSRDSHPTTDAEGVVRLHKWVLIRRERIFRPPFQETP